MSASKLMTNQFSYWSSNFLTTATTWAKLLYFGKRFKSDIIAILQLAKSVLHNFWKRSYLALRLMLVSLTLRFLDIFRRASSAVPANSIPPMTTGDFGLSIEVAVEGDVELLVELTLALAAVTFKVKPALSGFFCKRQQYTD